MHSSHQSLRVSDRKRFDQRTFKSHLVLLNSLAKDEISHPFSMKKHLFPAHSDRADKDMPRKTPLEMSSRRRVCIGSTTLFKNETDFASRGQPDFIPL